MFNTFLCILHLPYHAFRHRFINFELHNECYESRFFNDFLGRAHCLKDCDICFEHDSVYHTKVDFGLTSHDKFKFRSFACDYDLDDQIFQNFPISSLYHLCTSSCTLPVVHRNNFIPSAITLC